MRVENWNQEFLEALLKAQEAGVSFAWVAPSTSGAGIGLAPQVHCLSWSSYMVEAITGKDYYKELASELDYNSPLSAMKALRSLGFESVDQLIGSLFPEKRKVYAQRGDLALVPADPENIPEDLEGLRLAVGVVDPPWVWIVDATHGIERVSLDLATKVFEVN